MDGGTLRLLLAVPVGDEQREDAAEEREVGEAADGERPEGGVVVATAVRVGLHLVGQRDGHDQVQQEQHHDHEQLWGGRQGELEG